MYLARNMTFLAETALWEGQTDEAAQWLAQSLTQEADPGIIIIYEVVRLFVAAHLRRHRGSISAPPCCSGWRNRRIARFIMRTPGCCAPKPTPHWRPCAPRSTRRSLSRRSLRDSSSRSTRHLLPFSTQRLSRREARKRCAKNTLKSLQRGTMAYQALWNARQLGNGRYN